MYGDGKPDRDYVERPGGFIQRVYSEAEAADWARTWPELSTRPLALAELRVNLPLRRALFKEFGVFGAIATLRDPSIALRVLALYAPHARAVIDNGFKQSLEGRDVLLYNQVHAVMMNMLANIRRDLIQRKTGRRPAPPTTQPHHVDRQHRVS